MASNVFSYGWRVGAATLSGSVTETLGDTDISSDIALTSSQANKQLDIVIDVSAMRSLFILCENAIVIKTNSSGSPDNTLTIPANTPVSWQRTLNAIFPCPLTSDVTALYITNGAASATTAYIRISSDQTP